MPRNISGGMLTPLLTNNIMPAFAASITFKSEVVYVWSGVGNLVYGGNTYLGVGDFGKVDGVVEGSDVQAYGTTITLSGINPNLLSESLTDIQLGAPVILYFLLLNSSNGSILGTPYPLFIGTVDKPDVNFGTDTISIALHLENRLSNLQRANMRRYTSADQNLYYPNDSGFQGVEGLNDQALVWTV